jgi:anti-sigma B factor antagonist
MAAREPNRVLTVEVDPDRDALVIRTIGDLDLVSAEAFESKVREALASGALAVLLDLSQVEFIDSTGLRALLAAERLSSMNRCRFGILRELSPAVRRSFEVSGMAEFLRFVD